MQHTNFDRKACQSSTSFSHVTDLFLRMSGLIVITAHVWSLSIYDDFRGVIAVDRAQRHSAKLSPNSVASDLH